MIDYREITAKDVSPGLVADINELMPQLLPEARLMTDAYMRRMFEAGVRFFAALDEKKLVGTVLLVPALLLVGRKDWLEDLVVDKAYRGQGIAQKLMDMVEAASRADGSRHLNLTSGRERQGSHELYLSRGYELRNADVYRRKG